MAPTRSRATLQLLTTVLLVSNLVNAAALPHQVLDPRVPTTEGEQLPAEVAEALRASVGDDPNNVFQKVEDAFKSRTGLEVIKDFFARIFGWNEDDDDTPTEPTAPTTSTAVPTFVTLTGTSVSSDALTITLEPSSSVETVIITTEPSTPEETLITTTEPSAPGETIILSEPSAPIETITIIGSEPPTETSILPTPPVIIVTVPSPSTGEDVSSEAPEVTSAPSASYDFSILPVGPVSTAVNATLPAPEFSSAPYSNKTSLLPTAVPITGEFSAIPFPGTGIPSGASVSTTVILVTATTTKLPLGTGTGIVGTASGSPVTFTEIPIYPNTTSGLITLLPGTGTPVSFSEIPGYTPTTSGLVTGLPGTGTAVGTGAPISFSEIPLYPNTTSGLVTGLPGTGTAVGTGSPVSFTEIAVYPNTTTGLITLLPGTGLPVGTGAPVSFSEIPVFPNTTTTTVFTTIEAPPSGTGVIGTVTGTGSPVSFTEIPLYPNATTIYSTTTITLSGTGLPAIPTSNTTINDTTPAFPGLLTLRGICQDPVVKVVTLPLISRFYGPSGYPALRTFPGCTVPNNRQAFQAPGLLNCSALGVEVQRCQASGRKVLLSIKGDGLEAVGGNANFGDPRFDAKPYGLAYGDSGSSSVTYDNVENAKDDGDLQKRQITVDIDIDFPPFGEGFHLPHLPGFSARSGRPTSTPRPSSSKTSSPSHLSSVSKSRSLTVRTSGVVTSSKSSGSVKTGRPTPTPRPSKSKVSSKSHLSSVSHSHSPTIKSSRIITSTKSNSRAKSGRTTPTPRPSKSKASLKSRPHSVSHSHSESPVHKTSSVHSPTIISESFIPIISGASSASAGTPSSSNVTSTAVPETNTASTAAAATPVSASASPEMSAFNPPLPDPTPFPNLFNENHPPTAFALTLFSLFGEGHTERADLRPLGPDVGGPASPKVFNGREWVTPPTSSVPLISRPLGEEVVVDGFDVQLPEQWKGKYQDTKFRNLVARLRELDAEAFKESGGIEGGPGDLGADGESVVFFGYVGQLLKVRRGAAEVSEAGWIEWDGTW